MCQLEAREEEKVLSVTNINVNMYHRLALVYQARGEASVSKALLGSPLGQQPQGSQYALGRAAARAAGRASKRQAAASCTYFVLLSTRRRHETFRAAVAAAAARR